MHDNLCSPWESRHDFQPSNGGWVDTWTNTRVSEASVNSWRNACEAQVKASSEAQQEKGQPTQEDSPKVDTPCDFSTWGKVNQKADS